MSTSKLHTDTVYHISLNSDKVLGTALKSRHSQNSIVPFESMNKRLVAEKPALRVWPKMTTY